jgi:hypothetical protein
MQRRELQENPGQTIREPAMALFTVDSRDRTIGAKVNDFVINRQQTLMQGYMTRVALTEINFNWNIPNVNQYNNTFSIMLFPNDPVSIPALYRYVLSVEIPVQFYGPTVLGQVIENELNDAITALAATYPALPDYYEIEIVWVSIDNSFSVANIHEHIPGNPNSISAIGVVNTPGKNQDVLDLMGFSSPPTPSTSLLTGTNCARKIFGSLASMLYTPYFDIVSNELTKKQNVLDNSTNQLTGRNIIARIYINPEYVTPVPLTFKDGNPTVPNEDGLYNIIGTRPFTISKEFQNPKQIFWDTKEFISVVDLKLIDYKGDVLCEVPSEYDPDLNIFLFGSGKTNWQLTFQITET